MAEGEAAIGWPVARNYAGRTGGGAKCGVHFFEGVATDTAVDFERLLWKHALLKLDDSKTGLFAVNAVWFAISTGIE